MIRKILSRPPPRIETKCLILLLAALVCFSTPRTFANTNEFSWLTLLPPGASCLDSWTFEATNWDSDFGFAPLSYTNIQQVETGWEDGYALQVDTTNAAWLTYAITQDAPGYGVWSNLSLATGSIEFLFSSSWQSDDTNFYGTGPGDFGRLISVGVWTTNAASDFWSLYLNPAGTAIHFASGTNGIGTNYLSASISWDSSAWHQVVLTYSTTNTYIYIDGQLAASGDGVRYLPSGAVLTNGFAIGSDLATGFQQAHGQFAGIYTYNYPLSAADVANDYAAIYPELPEPFHPGGGFAADFAPPPSPLPGGGGDGGSISYPGPINFPTNSLWLSITNVATNIVYAGLHGGTDYVYEVFSLTNLSPAKAVSNWNIETEVFPGTNVTSAPFTVAMNGRSALYLWARDWTGITSDGNTTPEWWFWLWYHSINELDGNLDAQGHTLRYDYLHHLDPGLNFSILPANQSVTQGSNAVFAVTNLGPALLSYQWYWNGAPLSDGGGISGSGSATLTVSGVQPTQAGNYYVMAANASGSNVTAAAALAVAPAQTYNSAPLYPLSPYAYWNVTDISDPGQPVEIGELQEPFTEPTYGEDLSIPACNTFWHTSPGATVAEAYGTTSSGGISNKGTVFKLTVNGPQGIQPNELALSGNMLYGTTAGFSETNVYNNFGTLFSLSTNGSKLITLLGFNPAKSTITGQQGAEGAEPEAGLVVAGGAKYGTTSSGGPNGFGTVFCFTNGELNNWHAFAGPADGDGASPCANLVLAGNMLFGTTVYGGNDAEGVGYGTVFEIDTNGDASSYQILHEFTGGSDDGAYPVGGLLLVGGVLYGTTYGGGGPENPGTVFSLNLSTTNYSVLHDFGSGRYDGTKPAAGLVASGAALYGTTESGGTNSAGTVFSLTGTNYAVLHSFNEASVNDGAEPAAHLVVSGGALFGTTEAGGLNNYGTVFSLNTSGSGYTNLYSFQDAADGAYPQTALVLSGNALFGTTSGDPGSPTVPNYGTIFSIDTNGANFAVLQTFTTNGFAVIHSFTGTDGANPSSQLALSGSTFYNIFTTVYGTTASGGANGYGDVFKVNTDGTGFADLYDFGGTNDGRYPKDGLLISANTLYGATSNSLFKINTDGTGFACLTNLVGASQLLLSPSGATLYGSISNGGAFGYGSVFGINTDGSGFTNIVSFPGGTGGQYPNPELELYSLENPITNNGSVLLTLFGTTRSGGTNGNGMLFGVATDGSGFNDLHDFTGGTDGGYPVGGLLLTNNNIVSGNDATCLYGLTSAGGTNGGGTIFALNPNGGSLATIYNFNTNSRPTGKLAFLGQTLLGTTAGSGAYTNGQVYSVQFDGSGFADLEDFNGGNGAAPLAGVILPVVDYPMSIWALDAAITVSAESLTNASYAIAVDNDFILFVNGALVSFTNHPNSAAWASSYPSLAPHLHPGTNDVRVIIAGDNDQIDYFTMQIKSTLTNTLFGTASAGGVDNFGTIFAITPQGSETTLHSFSGPPDGQHPIGDLVLAGTNLYGITQFGGLITAIGNSAGNGVIFSINTNGSNYRVLHTFTNSPDGANPVAGLTLAGNTLYGTTASGGANETGTIFKINTDGSGYAQLYSFAGGGDGAEPQAPLLLVGANLYGTASAGGAGPAGTIFVIGTNGFYTNLYSFNVSPDDGSGPAGRLAISSNTLYGATSQGGAAGAGAIFSFAIGETNDQVLYSFTNMPDGEFPQGGLTLSGNTLYGTTREGGAANSGTIFGIGVNGSGYSILQSFDLEFDTDNGQNPASDLFVLGNSLYGTTFYGGANSEGMIFEISTNGVFNDVYDFRDIPDGEIPAGGVCAP